MNCKPGDLAVIVRPGTTARNLGKLVSVKHQSQIWGPGWWFIETLSPCHGTNGDRMTCGAIEDSRLRPIRDPGDNATDEMVQLLGSPAWQRAWSEA